MRQGANPDGSTGRNHEVYRPARGYRREACAVTAELGDHETRIANTFAEVARRLHQADSAQETWQQITDLASDIHASFAHAAVSILHVGGKIDTPAASDDVGPAVDRIQYEENQGPCLSAIRDADIFVSGDL